MSVAAGFNEYVERTHKLKANKTIAEKYILQLNGKVRPNEHSRLSYCN